MADLSLDNPTEGRYEWENAEVLMAALQTMAPTREQLKWRKRWVAELRSGKWTQGMLQLLYHDELGNMRYCCLGVFAECINKENLGWSLDSAAHEAQRLDDCELLSASAAEQLLGLRPIKVGDVLFETPGLLRFFASLNDSDDLTFDQIADTVEFTLITPWEL